MTGASLRRIQDRTSLVLSYVMERRIDVYGKDWNELLRYHNSIGLSEPSRVSIVPDLPRMIPTYGDLLIVVALLLAAMCSGPLQFTRHDVYPPGMHPVSIVLHVLFATFATIAIWEALDQPHPSPGLIVLIAAGMALLLGRWLIGAKLQWAMVLGLARIPP
jgi:hypothetical protein